VRKSLIAGNWKMNGSLALVETLVNAITQNAAAFPQTEIALMPPFVYLPQAHNMLKHSPVKLGAQNLYPGTHGAYTGEVSGAMLKEMGCEYVLIGHSERRTLLHEDLALLAEKFKAAIAAHLKPILCVGETQQEREQGKTERVIRLQIESVIEAAGGAAFQNAVIAYEPVWAIGTGLTATPEQAQAVHAFIRSLFSQNNVDLGNTIRILYGGSMKPENAASLLAMPDIDGGLIGGASLEAKSFLKICTAAETLQISHAAED
jgi:triosephosphate isomerase